jgi:hypothetical protein
MGAAAAAFGDLFAHGRGALMRTRSGLRQGGERPGRLTAFPIFA